MSRVGASHNRILLLESASADCPELAEMLKQLGEVRVESTIESALSVLGKGRFDLFVGPCREVFEAKQSTLGSQLGAVLDTIGQGVCLMDLQGQVIWSNAKLNQMPEEVIRRIQAHRVDSGDHRDGGSLLNRSRSLSLVTDADQHFEARITPIPDQHGVTRLVVSISDVTRARRLQKKIDAIDNAGRELVRVDTDQLAKMHAQQRLELLEQKIIRYTRELLQFDNFAIRLLDKESNRLELVLCAGLPPEAQQIDVFKSPEGNGISGHVAATGRSYICPDVTQDSRYLQGIDNAKSSLTVPLRLHDQVIGVFNIESDRLAAFDEDDRQFAEIFGRYIAIALHILDLLVVERHTTTGRLANNVSTEIAGPLGEILADATTLMEDYIGHDDLRHRLQTIADNVARIRETLKHVAAPTGGILGYKSAPPETDPALEGKVMLVIDDEEIIRTTIRDVLANHGCDVDMAQDAHEALAMVKQRDYDLVISDIKLPSSSGYEIFRTIKETRPDCPVMFMTGFGYDPNHTIIRATPEGLAAVLYKPFKVDELLMEVRSAVSPHAEE
jgi:CheY-like chemotaxis protein